MESSVTGKNEIPDIAPRLPPWDEESQIDMDFGKDEGLFPGSEIDA